MGDTEAAGRRAFQKIGDALMGDPFGKGRAAREQQKAEKRARKRAEAEAARGRQFAADQAAIGSQAAREQYGSAIDTLKASRGDITGGYSSALSALGEGYGQARGDLGQVSALRGFIPGATTSINPYDVTGQQSELARLMSGGDFTQDPGYQFRQQQGEQAINRAAAARGGRLSARTLQELGRFNSGLASQEFGAAAQRASSLDAFRQQALMNQAGRTDAAALQAQANQQSLAGMGVQGQMSLADLANKYATNQANLYTGQGAALAGLAANQANMYSGLGGTLAQLYGNLGATGAGVSQNLMPLLMGTANAGAGIKAQGELEQQIAGMAIGGAIGGAGAAAAKAAGSGSSTAAGGSTLQQGDLGTGSYQLKKPT